MIPLVGKLWLVVFSVSPLDSERFATPEPEPKLIVVVGADARLELLKSRMPPVIVIEPIVPSEPLPSRKTRPLLIVMFDTELAVLVVRIRSFDEVCESVPAPLITPLIVWLFAPFA